MSVQVFETSGGNRLILIAKAVSLLAILVTAGWAQNRPLAAGLLLGAALWWLALSDLTNLRLPDWATLPLIPAGLAYGTFATGQEGLLDGLAGAVLGAALIGSVGWGYRRLRGRDGIGFGDLKLLAALGAWLGWEALPMVLGIAAIGSLIAVGIAMLGGWRPAWTSRLPFGTALAAAGWLLWCAPL